MQKIKPLFGRIIIKELKVVQESNLIYIPETTSDPYGMTGVAKGVVLESGDSKEIKDGNIVIFNKRHARFIRLDNEDILSLDESEIMSIITEI